MAPVEVRLGLIGCGTVGSAFAASFAERRAALEAITSTRLRLTRVAVLRPHLRDPRLAPAPLTDDAASIAADPRIDIVVEASGAPNAADRFARRLRRAGGISAQQRVKAPRSRTNGEKVQVDETEEHDDLSTVANGPEIPGEVRLEVRDRHFAREEEGDRARQKAKHDERSSERLQHTGNPKLREHRRRSVPRPGRIDEKTEELLHPVLHEHQPRHDTQ